MACRDEQRATDAAKDIIAETGSDKVLVRILDLNSFESVRAFAKLISETEERLDILVNNAGELLRKQAERLLSFNQSSFI